MKPEQGFFRLPGVDLEITLPLGMGSLINSRLSPNLFRDLLLTGMRIGGLEALGKKVVDRAVPADQVLGQAVSLAASLAGMDLRTFQTLKQGMFAESLVLLNKSQI
jgi:enoyl-CoA hydratase/carnithine racemase